MGFVICWRGSNSNNQELSSKRVRGLFDTKDVMCHTEHLRRGACVELSHSRSARVGETKNKDVSSPYMVIFHVYVFFAPRFTMSEIMR